MNKLIIKEYCWVAYTKPNNEPIVFVATSLNGAIQMLRADKLQWSALEPLETALKQGFTHRWGHMEVSEWHK